MNSVSILIIFSLFNLSASALADGTDDTFYGVDSWAQSYMALHDLEGFNRLDLANGLQCGVEDPAGKRMTTAGQELVRGLDRLLIQQCEDAVPMGKTVLVNDILQEKCSDKPGEPSFLTAVKKYSVERGDAGFTIHLKTNFQTTSDVSNERRHQMSDNITACARDMKTFFARYGVSLDYQFEMNAKLDSNIETDIDLIDGVGRSTARDYFYQDYDSCSPEILESNAHPAYPGCEGKRQRDFCLTMLHETGHTLGLEDEYEDNEQCPDRTFPELEVVPHPTSVMIYENKGWNEVEFFPRHFATILNPLCNQSATATQLVKDKLRETLFNQNGPQNYKLKAAAFETLFLSNSTDENRELVRSVLPIAGAKEIFDNVNLSVLKNNDLQNIAIPELLDVPSPILRKKALNALCAVQPNVDDSVAIQELLRRMQTMFHDKNSETAELAISCSGKYGPHSKSLADQLMHLAEHSKNGDLQLAALTGLDQLAEDVRPSENFYLSLWRKNADKEEVGNAALDVLSTLPVVSTATMQLLASFLHSDSDEAESAENFFKTYLNQNENPFPRRIQVIIAEKAKDPDVQTRIVSILVARKFDADLAVPVLLRVLNSSDLSGLHNDIKKRLESYGVNK